MYICSSVVNIKRYNHVHVACIVIIIIIVTILIIIINRMRDWGF